MGTVGVRGKVGWRGLGEGDAGWKRMGKGDGCALGET